MTREDLIHLSNQFLIEEIEIDENLLKKNALLKEDLGIDSLDFVDIVVLVERNFSFKIKTEEMAEVKTLGDFYDYIESKIGSSN